MYELLKILEELNGLSGSMDPVLRVFDPISLPMPDFKLPQLGFVNLVSYLYVLYFEVGRTSLEFLVDRLPAYDLDLYFLFYWDDASGNNLRQMAENLGKMYSINWDSQIRSEKVDEGKTLRIIDGKNIIIITVAENGETCDLNVNGSEYHNLSLKADGDKTAVMISTGLEKHQETVRYLRTFLFHNLNLKKQRDQEIRIYCEKWFNEQCGTRYPSSEIEWEKLVVRLLQEAKNLLNQIKLCVRYIEKDDSRNQIINDWKFKLERHHPPEEFDRVISQVARDLGKDSLDVARFRRRYYDRWVDQLNLIQGHYEFSVEARKLIESSIMETLSPILPITGEDIIKELGLSPGPRVGKGLTLARELDAGQHLSRDDLIKKLRIAFDNGEI